MTIMGTLLHRMQANSFEFVVRQNHGRPGGRANRHLPLPAGKWAENRFLENLTSAAQF